MAWVLPLSWLALLVAAYPARKALFAETWGLRAYLGWGLRFYLALLGFWLGIALAPAVVLSAGPRWPWAAGILSLVLLLAGTLWAAVLRLLLGARAIQGQGVPA